MILLVALIVAAQVAVSGVVGWVGLIVPHVARALVGPDHRRLIPASGLIGDLFTLAIDDLARMIASREVPVGLLTAVGVERLQRRLDFVADAVRFRHVMSLTTTR